MPPESLFFRKAHPEQARIAQWTATDYLLADLFDLTHAGLAAGSRKQPPKYPRPAEQIETEKHQLEQRDKLLAWRRARDEQRQRDGR